jgi:uncharacterized protein YybS (DUF2232 family)
MRSERSTGWIQALLNRRFEAIRDTLAGIAALSLASLIINSVPLVGSAILVLLPLPILYGYLKNGRIHGSIVLIVSLCVVSITLKSYDQIFGLPVLVLFVSGVLGIVLSELLKKHYSIEKTIFLPVTMLLALWFSFIFYATSLLEVSLWQWLKNFIYKSIQESITFYAELEIPDETIRFLKNNASQIADFFMKILPSIALISAVFIVWINVLMIRGLLKKTGQLNPDLNDLSLWKSPDKLVWLLIAGGMMLLAPVEWIKFLGINILITTLFIYLLQGLAITSFFFKQKNIPRLLRAIFYFSIFIQQYFTLLIVATGLFDLWIDFRKRIRPIAD